MARDEFEGRFLDFMHEINEAANRHGFSVSDDDAWRRVFGILERREPGFSFRVLGAWQAAHGPGAVPTATAVRAWHQRGIVARLRMIETERRHGAGGLR